jgi:hypothetical protein
MTMGTIGYMPPEQARGQVERIDARSVIWAVGATLFTLVSGQPLQDAPTKNEALLLAMTQPVTPVRAKMPDLPEDVCAVLDRALAFEKEERFADARAMQQAIRALRPTEAAAAPAPPPSLHAGATDVGFAVAAKTIPMASAPTHPHAPALPAPSAPAGRGMKVAVATFAAAMLVGGLAMFAWAPRGGAPARPAAPPEETPTATQTQPEPVPAVAPPGVSASASAPEASARKPPPLLAVPASTAPPAPPPASTRPAPPPAPTRSAPPDPLGPRR